MTTIINRDLIEGALCLSGPSIRRILNTEGMTWGPNWIAGYIAAPGLLLFDEYIPFQFGGEDCDKWNQESWGDRSKFSNIALEKIKLIMREKLPSSVIIATKPWVLKGGEFLYAGGYYQDDIGVSASGAKGRTDEACAKIIHTNICLLAFLETDRRIAENKMEI